MTDKTYNGWTNYETWRVNLEMFDGQPVHDIDEHTDAYELGKLIKELAEEYITEGADALAFTYAVDYARAFLDEVNWREIAEHMIADYTAAA
jgi:hypothetical protein